VSEAPVCPNCGHHSVIGNIFCITCGTPLDKEPHTHSSPLQPQTTPSGPGYVTMPDVARTTGISRTKTGILLLTIGFVLRPVSYVGLTAVGLGLVGGLLSIIGAILVLLGRKPFGQRHSKYTIYSAVIYLAGGAATTVGTFALLFAEVSIMLNRTSVSAQQQGVTSAYNEMLIGSLIGWALIGVAFSLFTYALQNSTGRLLLYGAYATIVAVYGFVFYVIFPQAASTVSLAFSTGAYNSAPIRALLAQQQQLDLLAFIPAVIYAIAYYQVYQRIARGEIPVSTPRSAVSSQGAL
jgi:uncharacterized membrane protein